MADEERTEGFWKRIGKTAGLIVEVPDEAPAEATTKVSQAVAPVSRTVTQPVISVPRVAVSAVTRSSSTTSVEPDPNIQKKLRDAIASINTPGYRELLDTLDALSDFPPDSRLKGALSVLKKKGMSSTVVLGELDLITKVLNSEETRFENDIEQATKSEIDNEQREVANITSKVGDHEATIARLQDEIRALNEEKSQRLTRVDDLKDSKADAEARFGATIETVRSEISSMREQLQKV